MALKGSRSLDQYNGDEQLEVPVDHNIPTLMGELALAVTKPVSALVKLEQYEVGALSLLQI